MYQPASSSVQECVAVAIESDVAEPYILPELRTIRDSTEGAEPQRSLTSNAPAAPNHTPDTVTCELIEVSAPKDQSWRPNCNFQANGE